MMSSESSPAPPSSSSSSASSQLPSSSSTSSQPLTLKASEAIFIQQNPLAQQIVLEHQPSTDPLGEQTHYAIRHQIEEEDEADSLPNFSEEPPAPSIHEQEEQEQEQPQLQLKQLVARKGSRPRRESTLSEENINSVLVWKNLTVTTKARGSSDVKVLLNNVSGAMTGGMWAVMGPSGCGKSTLLNTLACRLDVNTTVVGEMRLNGRPYHNAELKKMSGYVMQDDLLNGSLTVRETLYYTAALRLPRTFTSQERAERVEEVIREMGLTHCQDVIVGDPQQKGISGGERRRLCIGMELLMRPTLLFLDEPTSGLDSVTAVSLGRLLRRLSRTRKCSVICSIHQPAARLFALFDRLLLLKSGRILYQGSIPGALQLFEDCGFPVPHYSNPADHILDVITPPMDGTLALKKAAELSTAARDADRDRQFGFKGQGPLQMEIAAAGDQEHNHAVSSKNGLSIDVSKVNSWPADDHLSDATPLGRALTLRRRYTLERSQQLEARHFMTPIKGDDAETAVTPGRDDLRNEAILLKNFQLPPVDLTLGQDKPQLDSDVIGVSWFRQLRILMERNTKETWRKRHKVMIAFIQSLIMAVLIGTVFLFIGTSQTSVVRRQPVLQFLCINQGAFAAMSIINAFPAERSLMLRERAAGTYYASAYFLARTTIDTLVQIPQIVCFSVVTYYLIGLQDVASKFIIYLLFMILCNLSATSLALMVSALCKTTDFATVMLSFVLEVCRLFGGFFLAPKNLPKYFSWLDALSYIKYSYVGISLNELHGLELHCNPGQFKKDSNGNEFCPITSGQFTIDQLGLGFISMNGCAGVLVGYIIFCRLVAYWGIRNLKH